MGLPQPTSAIERGLLRDRIEVLKPKKPAAVAPETPISEVLKTMISQSIGCVLIVDGQNRVLGIFSERDALMRVNVDFARLAARPVSTVMTPNPETLRVQDKIAFALHRMNVGGFRHVPVTDGGKLAGVISIRDILAYLTAQGSGRA